jgi:hypothetical protein
MCRVLRSENFCARQAGGCAVPDPGRFGNQAFGHAPTLTWWPGVVLFGGNGVALNLGQKAEAKGLTVMRVADPAKKTAEM